MINRVVLVGRLSRDPELRRTPRGEAVTSFTLAVNRNFTSREGQQQADFINCIIWRKPAENVEKYCSKGSLVGVEGRLQTRSYDNSQGKKIYVVEVICDSVQFLETKSARERQLQQMQQPQNKADSKTYNSEDLEKEFDNSANTFDILPEDLPFE